MDQVDNGLHELTVDLFYSLFKANDHEMVNILADIQASISSKQNSTLLEEVHESEVRKALLQMSPDISPGPNSMSPGFYHKFWPIVEGDVVKFLRNYFENGVLSEKSTDTNIVLIPNKTNPL